MSKSTLYFAFVALWIILRVLYVKAIFSPNIKGTPKGKKITVKYKIIADRKHNISRLNLILSFGFIIRFSIAFLLIKNQNKFKKPSERIDKAINEHEYYNFRNLKGFALIILLVLMAIFLDSIKFLIRM